MTICVLAMQNKALKDRIMIHEFKYWTMNQGIESIIATFVGETCVITRILMLFATYTALDQVLYGFYELETYNV